MALLQARTARTMLLLPFFCRANALEPAHLSRIVTLSNLNISAGKDAKDASTLSMEATANTFRYLDKNEKIANQKAKEKKEAKQ